MVHLTKNQEMGVALGAVILLIIIIIIAVRWYKNKHPSTKSTKSQMQSDAFNWPTNDMLVGSHTYPYGHQAGNWSSAGYEAR